MEFSAVHVVIILKSVSKLLINANSINDICYRGLFLLFGTECCVSDDVIRVPGVNRGKHISVCVV